MLDDKEGKRDVNRWDSMPGEYNPAELNKSSWGCWTMVVEKLAWVNDIILEVLNYGLSC